MELLDARRLTGRNVVWSYPGAVLDVRLEPGDDLDALISHWQASVERMLSAVGWASEQSTARPMAAGGVALAISAPLDGLYSAVELAEWAFAAATHLLARQPVPDFDAQAARLRQLIADEANPALRQLSADAAHHGVSFLSDDDEVSVGLGHGSRCWPVDAIEPPDDWDEIADIPVGLVSGTNGKTTTVRLAMHMLRQAGNRVGLSSTDWIGVDDQILDRGDYSGPGGARSVLRQPNVDVAVLETARGGLLRRGLGVQRADAALITNIAEDHLGDFGSQDLTELLAVKWVIMSALDQRSHAILNADDPLLLDKARELAVPIIWFALSPDHPKLAEHRSGGGQTVAVVDGAFSRYDGRAWHRLCDVAAVPLTMNGLAHHNISNALGAIGLCHALGLDDDSIAAGLESMSLEQNPGRCNLYQIDQVEVLLDFAHNPHALQGIFNIASQLPAKRRILCFGQAGDRPDDSIRELAQHAWAIGLDRVIISELPDHRRGREAGEVFALLRQELLTQGAQPEQIAHYQDEADSLSDALGWAQPGDLVIMLALAEASAIRDRLEGLAS